MDGDKIVSVNGEDVENFYDVVPKLVVSDSVTVLRDNVNKTIALPKSLIGKLVDPQVSRLLVQHIRNGVMHLCLASVHLFGLEQIWSLVHFPAPHLNVGIK